MLNKYFIEFNDFRSLDLNVFVKSRVAKPASNMEYETIEVPGREEILYKEKGFKDIEIPISFNFLSKNNNSWDEDFRVIKQWLFSNGNKKLKFSDDPNYFYIVKKVVIDTPERILKRIGRFTVVFTCEPFIYLEEGQEIINLESFLYNFNMLSKPIYYITGNGFLNLKINNKNITVNVGGKIIINTKLGLCFKDNGVVNNVALSGAYKDLYLKEGGNIFEYPSNFKIEILPNWRCR